jgi:hypothetical protein
MANGYIVVWAGQSLCNNNPGMTLPNTDSKSNVYMMEPTKRTFSTFQINPNDPKHNVFTNTQAYRNCPAIKFADEWQARVNAGLLSGNLYSILCARDGSSFSTDYLIDDLSHWNLDRRRNDGLGNWDNTLYSIPSDTGGGTWTEGDANSLVSTLEQSVSVAAAQVTANGDTPYLLFLCFIHGQADALLSSSASQYQANEEGLKTKVATALGVSNFPWYTVKLSGNNRTGTSVINSGKDSMAANDSDVKIIDPTQFPEYVISSPEYGGIHNDGTHYGDRGGWRVAEECYKLSIDNENFGIAL